MSNDINIIHNYYNLLVYYVYKYCLFVLHMCNITLTRRRGSRPNGTRNNCNGISLNNQSLHKVGSMWFVNINKNVVNVCGKKS